MSSSGPYKLTTDSNSCPACYRSYGWRITSRQGPAGIFKDSDLSNTEPFARKLTEALNEAYEEGRRSVLAEQREEKKRETERTVSISRAQIGEFFISDATLEVAASSWTSRKLNFRREVAQNHRPTFDDSILAIYPYSPDAGCEVPLALLDHGDNHSDAWRSGCMMWGFLMADAPKLLKELRSTVRILGPASKAISSPREASTLRAVLASISSTIARYQR